MASTTPNSASAPTSLLPPLDFAPQGIINITSSSAATFLASLLTGTPPPCCPNTTCHLPIFNPLDTPATVGSLTLPLWSQFLNLYPDQAFAKQLQGTLRHGVKLGYSGPLHYNTRLSVPNLRMDQDDKLHLCQEIKA
ncbi:uncharacterized protein UBRO_20424 [Ustilago bromivora]|uniref:Uncharacterized protein n=1 Tax=Ustilago bromivora TaxID=307758 RepID=A0A1K0FVX5_9BASI|nr:uncharacterized protein UBRO_20424 [Ustilago bromivora]